MRALVSSSYGPLEDLIFADLPVPVPGPGQVLVRTQAVALNPADRALVLAGLLFIAIGIGLSLY